MRSGRWCGAPPRFSPAMVPSARRIAGRRIRATRRSPSPPKSPRCWSPPTWPTRRQTRRPRRICEKRRTPGTPASNAGCMSPARHSRSSTASTGITSASPSPIEPTRRRRVTGSCRSRTVRRIESTGPAALMVSLDALAFVRFGLRAPDDPRIVEHGQGHRRDAQGRHAERTGVASLSGRRLRRTRRRRAVRRDRHRPRLATPHRRARPLRAGGRTPAHGRTTGAGARSLCRRQRSAAGADLGQRRYS